MRHMKHRLLTITVATAVAMALTVPQALANHESSPKSGPDHARGEDVAYPLVFPVQGANTFGDHFWSPRGSGIHHAVDIMANKMTPIVAVASGTVQWVGSRCCTLRIKHDDGWSSSYIHLNNDSPGTDDGQGWGIAPGITKGTHVNAGQLVAYVGDSGNAEGTSPHLHFELIDPHGVYVDPYLALRAAEGGAPVTVSGTTTTTCSVPTVGSLSTLTGSSSLIKRGARGDAVNQLQQFLRAAGHDVGPIDGIFGSKTVAGVRQFQERQGLSPDGVVGPVTRSAVKRIAAALPSSSALVSSSRTLRPGDRGSDVKQIQVLLQLAGHEVGGADGVLGPKTQTGIEAFQRQAGLTVDGKIGPNTRAQLSAALGLSGIDACS
jgi:peptidoglycan hydrolase-like protein with peptidoglycan-binding domain